MEDDILSHAGGDVPVDEIEKRYEAMGPIKPGFYRASLNGAKNFVAASTGSRAHELTFLILGGPFDGREVTDKLWIPSAEKLASKEDKDVKSVGNSQARIGKFGLVLGLFVKDRSGKNSYADPKKRDFIDVLDAECIIDVVLEPDQNNPDQKWPRLNFRGGIYRKDDRDAIAKLGGAAGNGAKRPDPTPPAKPAREVKRIL